MARKRKADCTPEEWEAQRKKDRERMASPEAKARHAAAEKRRRERNPERAKEQKEAYRARHYERIREMENARRRFLRTFNSFFRQRDIEEKRKARHRVAASRHTATITPFSNELYARIWNMVPRYADKEDIVSEAILLVLEGVSEEEAVKQGRRTHYRMFSKLNRTTVSMDEVSPYSGLSRHEILASEEAL